MATKKQTKSSGTSLALFKAWLSGIEEMQGEDWTPDAAQWQRIKAKLFEIEEAPPFVPEAAPRYGSLPAYAPQMPPQQMHSGFDVAVGGPAPRLPAPPQPYHHNPSTKTPDIDSTTGYTSDLV